jgi:hypothetical protein
MKEKFLKVEPKYEEKTSKYPTFPAPIAEGLIQNENKQRW